MSGPIDQTRRKLVQLGCAFGMTLLISPIVRADELLDVLADKNDSSSTTNGENHVIAVRVWPSSVYTRVTIEADNEIHAKSIAKSDELIIDIENSKLNDVLRNINVRDEDPIISDVGAKQLDPSTIRITVSLKQKINTKSQTMAPVSLGSVNYKYRYVLDMYPILHHEDSELNDDVLALLQLNSSDDDVKPAVVSLKQVAASKSDPIGKLANDLPKPNSNYYKPVDTDISLPKVKTNGKDKILVMIDPGHGGEDPGAIGPAGTKEKDVVLDVGKKLYDIIRQTDYMTAELTRSQDIFIPLGSRVAIARRAKADIFISIHADAFTTPAAKGASVFILSDRGASSGFAKWLAKTQNDADLIGGMSYKSQDKITSRVLLDMTQTWTLKKSTKLGQLLLARLAQIGKMHNGKLEEAAFAVLKAPDIPSVLVETAFISNPEEESLLNKADFRQKMALTIFNGLSSFSKII